MNSFEMDVSNLNALAFGNQSICLSLWFRFEENPKTKFKSLPCGKPLSNVALQNALCDVFKTSLGISQANENFNKIVFQRTHEQSIQWF